MAQPAPTVLAISPEQLVLGVRDKLVTDGVFPKSAAKVSMRMNPPVLALQADLYSITLPLSAYFDQKWGAGGMRYTNAVRSRYNVYPRVRNALDIAYESESWLTDSSDGILPLIRHVLDSLHGQFLSDVQSNLLTIEPMRAIFYGEPRQNYQMPEYGDVVIELEAFYLLNLDKTVL